MPSGWGVFISFEGPDGSGKSTQVRKLAEALSRLGYDVATASEPAAPPLAGASGR